MQGILPLLLFLASVLGAGEKPPKVISLAPSITEILCALNLQSSIVGVTDFCKDPYLQTDFSTLKVGGNTDPNLEKIVRSRPDVVLSLKGKGKDSARLEKLGLKVVEVNHMNLAGVLASIRLIGQVCGVEKKAEKLYQSLQLSVVEQDYRQGKKVLVTISRLSTQNNIRLWVAGNDGFYNRLLNICGARNAFQGDTKFQQITLEALVKLDPDVIILLREKMTSAEQQIEKKFWRKFPTLQAVKNNQFHIITGEEVMIPGPRFPILLKKFKDVLEKNE